MTKASNHPTDSSDEKKPSDGDTLSTQDSLNRVIKTLGGRHLIFRTQLDPWILIPKPYALISDFRGAVWFFYGLGQIWLTHKKYAEYDGWTARVSRLGSEKVKKLLDQLQGPITEFTHFCNEEGIEGTIVLDPGIIEFHWTFGYALKAEKEKPEKAHPVEAHFKTLVDAFLAAKSELRI
ncbi:MAG: hypothetical protein AAFN77_03540 [Planctomycetota bacterium]